MRHHEPAPIDFYFDFSSPYGYLASQKIEALAAKHGRTVDWRPMLLGVVFKQTGTAPLTEVPLKGDYSRHDFERSARFHGMPIPHAVRCSRFASQAPSRIVLWAKAQDPALAAPVARALVSRLLPSTASTFPIPTSRRTSRRRCNGPASTGRGARRPSTIRRSRMR